MFPQTKGKVKSEGGVESGGKHFTHEGRDHTGQHGANQEAEEWEDTVGKNAYCGFCRKER